MLVEPTPSPMDLQWRMFGIPIRVHPTFWLFSGIFGYMWFQLYGFPYLLLWIGCTFFSILLHELGHSFAGLAFGERSHIVLYSFGGLAIGNFHQVARWQRIVISLAGPAMNFLIFGIAFGIDEIVRGNEEWRRIFRFGIEWGPERHRVTLPGATLGFLKIMNLFWGVLNLLPIFPLDGGQVTRELCMAVSRRNGLAFSLGLSFLFAALIAVYSGLVMARPELPYPSAGVLRMDPLFSILMFGFLALNNFQLLQQVQREQRRWEYDEDPW